MNQELITYERSDFMPALSVAQATQRFNTLVEFVKDVMRENVDYGKVPGTDKNTLMKAGAEKLTTLFGLTVRFQVVEQAQDWTGEAHGDEPFFYYWYRCQLSRGELLIAEADGSCNSRETKYRWRESKRVCPHCGVAAINKSKFPPRGAPKGTPPGWYCYAKVGGCGAEFIADDAAITDQQTGRAANPDICDLVNTIQKMSQKRALVAATLIGCNASEFFTQDVEDINLAGDGASYAPPVAAVDTRSGEIIEPKSPRSEPSVSVKQPNNQASGFIEGLKALTEERQPAPTNGKRPRTRDEIEARLGELVIEAKALNIEIADATPTGKTDQQVIAAGQKLVALIDAAKRKAAMQEEQDLPL